MLYVHFFNIFEKIYVSQRIVNTNKIVNTSEYLNRYIFSLYYFKISVHISYILRK